MKLIASMIVRNELGRYLKPQLKHLLAFCDEVRVLDDGSEDGTGQFLFEASQQDDRVQVERWSHTTFYEHEGLARQRLLDWTLLGEPTHVLVIDADEFVADGLQARKLAEWEGTEVTTLPMQEVWKAWDSGIATREDGAWGTGSGCIWKVPPANVPLRIKDAALACGRNPTIIDSARIQRSVKLAAGPELLHFGWTNEAAREARYQRYVEHDDGQFHASQHLQSIMFPDIRVRMQTRKWPEGLEPYRPAILAAANG